MNILFLTMVKVDTLENRGIYTDLLRKFRDQGHKVYVVSPSERRENKSTCLFYENGCDMLNVKTLNLQKTNVIEKGLGIIAIEYQYLHAIKHHFNGIKFDLILYSTPPITFSKIITYFKRRDKAFSYLLLKDIFPQNAIDIGMMKKNGILHKIFRSKEKKLYALSDMIGCMSIANKEYITKNNNIDSKKVEVNPNSIGISGSEIEINSNSIRKKYSLPSDKTIFVYGGNLGKPQGISFLLDIIRECESQIPDAYFLIIGNGTEYRHIEKWFEVNKPGNAKLIQFLQKEEYDKVVKASDVGLIFLNKLFTIPNFPSRLLTYMEYKLPIFSATDNNTDIGQTIQNNNFGYGVESGDLILSIEYIRMLTVNKELRSSLGENGYKYLLQNFTVDISYKKIIDSLNALQKKN